jgi:signal transduction histidine kinase
VLARLQAAHLTLLVPPAQALLARLALRAGHPAQAIAYGQQSLTASQQMKSPAGIRDASYVLAQAYARHGNFAAAFQALRQFNVANDSLTSDVARRQVALLEFNHVQTEQRAQIRLLTQQNHFQAQAQELAHLRTQRQLLGIGVLALLPLLLAGLVLRHNRHRQAGRDAALRTRLAADLHDDVGSLLTQISLQSDLLREAPASPAQTLVRLHRLSDTSRRATRQMADVVWGLHTSSAKLPAVLVHMRDHAHEVLPLAGLTVDFAVSDEAAALHPSVAVCQTLYLIFKEALHNTVKHAHGATQVTIGLTQEAGRLCLNVRDNAHGPAPVARSGGHGLANMRLRAEAVGGTLSFTADTAGFGVMASLPG